MADASPIRGPRRLSPFQRCLLAITLVALEAALLIWVYTMDTGGLFPVADVQFCLILTSSDIACDAFRRTLQAGLFTIFVTTVVLALSRGGRVTERLLAFVESARFDPRWLLLNTAGLALVLAPYAWIAAGGAAAALAGWGLLLWIAGIALLGVGLMLWFAPLSAWRALFNAWVTLFVIGAMLLPFIARGLGSLAWAETGLQSATFATVIFLLEAIGAPVYFDPDTALIGIADFAVLVGHPCAGLAGIVLTSGALLGYAALMREHLRTDRLLLLLPVAVAVSWGFNAFRIAVLMVIGSVFSAELAIEGFHVYAGWISFVIVSGGMILVLDRLPWLQRTAEAPHLPPLWRDPAAALILPFFVFLTSGLVIGALFPQPALAYPLKALATGMALALFWRALPALPRKVDTAAILAGLVLAAIWIWVMAAAQTPRTRTELIGPLPAGLALGWIAIRLVGTAVFVPVAEEMFFRRYLMERLDLLPGWQGILFAATASSLLFGALHGVFWLAVLSGFVFVWLARRRGEIWDAVVAHAVANLVIGVAAITLDNYALI